MIECCEFGDPSNDGENVIEDCRPIDVTEDEFYSIYNRTCMRFVRSMVADKGCQLGNIHYF